MAVSEEDMIRGLVMGNWEKRESEKAKRCVEALIWDHSFIVWLWSFFIILR